MKYLTHFSRPLSLISIFLLVAGCIPSPSTLPVTPPAPRATRTAGPEPAITLYFTDPVLGEVPGGPADALEAAVQGASQSIDMAIYNFSLPGVEEALIQAAGRGVQVRMVMETDNMDNQSYRRLKAAGIPIVGDRNEALMHNKFAVIDGEEVWTGSMNFTPASAFQDENNLVSVDSPDLAADYTAEFEEMYTAHQFGAASPSETPAAPLKIDQVELEVLFSPDDGAVRRLLQLLRRSETSIQFLAYSFTSDLLVDAILERAADGVTVSGVMDAGQAVSNTGGEYDHFRQAGLDVRLYEASGLMHHKVLIIDGQIVVLGSYNFSNNAETRNDENLLILHDTQAAGRFLDVFERIQAEAEPGGEG